MFINLGMLWSFSSNWLGDSLFYRLDIPLFNMTLRSPGAASESSNKYSNFYANGPLFKRF